MKIVGENEMAARLDFVRPLEPPPEEDRESAWCVPFEYGENAKGTRISISKAREIAAELRAAIAEAEKRELLRAFKREEKRSEEIGRQYIEMSDKWCDAMAEVADLKRRLRRRK